MPLSDRRRALAPGIHGPLHRQRLSSTTTNLRAQEILMVAQRIAEATESLKPFQLSWKPWWSISIETFDPFGQRGKPHSASEAVNELRRLVDEEDWASEAMLKHFRDGFGRWIEVDDYDDGHSFAKIFNLHVDKLNQRKHSNGDHELLGYVQWNPNLRPPEGEAFDAQDTILAMVKQRLQQAAETHPETQQMIRSGSSLVQLPIMNHSSEHHLNNKFSASKKECERFEARTILAGRNSRTDRPLILRDMRDKLQENMWMRCCERAAELIVVHNARMGHLSVHTFHPGTAYPAIHDLDEMLKADKDWQIYLQVRRPQAISDLSQVLMMALDAGKPGEHLKSQGAHCFEEQIKEFLERELRHLGEDGEIARRFLNDLFGEKSEDRTWDHWEKIKEECILPSSRDSGLPPHKVYTSRKRVRVQVDQDDEGVFVPFEWDYELISVDPDGDDHEFLDIAFPATALGHCDELHPHQIVGKEYGRTHLEVVTTLIQLETAATNYRGGMIRYLSRLPKEDQRKIIMAGTKVARSPHIGLLVRKKAWCWTKKLLSWYMTQKAVERQKPTPSREEEDLYRSAKRYAEDEIKMHGFGAGRTEPSQFLKRMEKHYQCATTAPLEEILGSRSCRSHHFGREGKLRMATPVCETEAQTSQTKKRRNVVTLTGRLSSERLSSEKKAGRSPTAFEESKKTRHPKPPGHDDELPSPLMAPIRDKDNQRGEEYRDAKRLTGKTWRKLLRRPNPFRGVNGLPLHMQVGRYSNLEMKKFQRALRRLPESIPRKSSPADRCPIKNIVKVLHDPAKYAFGITGIACPKRRTKGLPTKDELAFFGKDFTADGQLKTSSPLWHINPKRLGLTPWNWQCYVGRKAVQQRFRFFSTRDRASRTVSDDDSGRNRVGHRRQSSRNVKKRR